MQSICAPPEQEPKKKVVPNWITNLPKFIEITNELKWSLKNPIPCSYWHLFPVGRYTKEQVIETCDEYDVRSWSEFIVFKTLDNERKEKYKVEIEQNKQEYIKNKEELEKSYLGKEIVYCNGEVVDVGRLGEYHYEALKKYPTSYVVEVEYEYRK